MAGAKVIKRPCPQCGTVYEWRRASGRYFAVCEACRQKDCVICGKKVPLARGAKNTCSDACASLKIRNIQSRHYAKKIAIDPDANKRAHAQRRERLLASPEEHEAALQQERERDRRRANDAEYKEKRRKYHATHYAANKTRVQKQRADYLQKLTPEARAERDEKHLAATLKSQKKRLEKLRQDPVAWREYREAQRRYMREYKRQRALAEMMKQTQELTNATDNDES